MFPALIHKAKRHVSITGPCPIPDEALLAAMTSTAYRGMEIELFMGKESDRSVASHAQRSYYPVLLATRMWIYPHLLPIILHPKHMMVDDEMGAIGLPNMNLRPFTLNYEIMLSAFEGSLDGLLCNNDATYRVAYTELTPEPWATES